jgi:hypothetical protein
MITIAQPLAVATAGGRLDLGRLLQPSYIDVDATESRTQWGLSKRACTRNAHGFVSHLNTQTHTHTLEHTPLVFTALCSLLCHQSAVVNARLLRGFLLGDDVLLLPFHSHTHTCAHIHVLSSQAHTRTQTHTYTHTHTLSLSFSHTTLTHQWPPPRPGHTCMWRM